MGKRRRPQTKDNAHPVDDEIPEGFQVLDPNEWSQKIASKSKKKRKFTPMAVLDDQPWNKLDTGTLEFSNDAPQMVSLESLDGSYYEKLFLREDEPAYKKQKLDHSSNDLDSSDGDSSSSEEFKEFPKFLSPATIKAKQKEKKETRFQYLLAPKTTDPDDEVIDEEEDYELEDDDHFDVEVTGVVVDDDYSDDDSDDLDSVVKEPDQTSLNLEQWCGADQRIIQAISTKLSITAPTPCQQLVLPAALSSRQDILLAAPTGSGKTFAFGIPIITRIMEIIEKEKSEETTEGITRPFALILAPTRELALQITKNLTIAASELPIRVVSIVGGMAAQKQERLLQKHPEIIVGTPGRLWNLLSHASTPGVVDYPLARFLVIDEADRMISQGNYKELRNILERLAPWKGNNGSKAGKEKNHDYDAAELWERSTKKKKMAVPRQTFICSATLTTANFIKDFEDGKKLSGKEGTYEGLLSCIDFQRPGKVINTTSQQLTAENLSEAKILCLLEEKDYYLYYLLNQYPGRTLVFVNSIHCLHRLISLFGLLRFPAFSLHAKMQQRQRLKNLDRFQESDHCVLIASDVAARGLDIPNIDHVIHYQIPRTSELYVHRSGRTARALKDGVSVMLVDPSDEACFKKICKLLHKTTADVPDFPIELRYFNTIRKIVNAAREVDELLHTKRKNTEDDKWLLELAEEADMDVTHMLDDETEEDQLKRKKESLVLENKKNVLRELLKLPLIKRGTSSRYINPETLGQVSETKRNSAIDDIRNRNCKSNTK